MYLNQTLQQHLWSVIRQNGKSQNEGNKKAKHAKIFRKTISYPPIGKRTNGGKK